MKCESVYKNTWRQYNALPNATQKKMSDAAAELLCCCCVMCCNATTEMIHQIEGNKQENKNATLQVQQHPVQEQMIQQQIMQEQVALQHQQIVLEQQAQQLKYREQLLREKELQQSKALTFTVTMPQPMAPPQEGHQYAYNPNY